MLNVLTEIKQELYFSLLDFSLKHCSKFIFIIRKNMKETENIKKLLFNLKQHLYKVEQKDEWPGTKLLNEKATIYTYYYNYSTTQILKKFSTNFFDWIQPDMPEDLCLLDEKEQPIITNIAHEKDIYIKTERSRENEYILFFNKNNIKFIFEN